MKRLFTFSLIISFIFCQSNLFAQNISAVEYEELINEIICDFTDFALKNQKGQPLYQDFIDFKEKAGYCNYYKAIEFLKSDARFPKVPTKTPDIVTIIFYDYYKTRYNESASNQEMYEILMNLFEEEDLKAFANSYASSYPSFETDLKGKIQEQLRVAEYNNEIVPEEDISATNSEFDNITNESVEEKKIDSPDDYTTDSQDEIESSNGLGNSLLLFGFLALLLAYGGYLWYQRRKNSSTSTSGQTTTMVARNQKSFWQRMTGRASKTEIYQGNLIELQTLIHNHKKALASIRQDVEDMHQKVNKLSALADKEEVVEEHLKALSEKLDEVETKQKDLLIILDDIENTPESEDTDDDAANLKIESDTKIIEEIVDETPVVSSTVKISSPPDLFFMPLPNADGSFNYKDWSASPIAIGLENQTFYRFEMLNNVEAKFVLYDNQENIEKAIENPDMYLNPVCKVLNVDFKKPKTIIIQKQNSGIVYKDGETWRLKEKAVVYYQ